MAYCSFLTGGLWLGQVIWEMGPWSSEMGYPPKDLGMKGLWHGIQVGVLGAPLTPILGVPQMTPLFSNKNGGTQNQCCRWPTNMVFISIDHPYEPVKTHIWNLRISTVYGRNRAKTEKTGFFGWPRKGSLRLFKCDFLSSGTWGDMNWMENLWFGMDIAP